MLERAKDLRDHHAKQYDLCKERIPELEQKHQELRDLVEYFDYHKGVQGKVLFLLGEYADTPLNVEKNIQGQKGRMAYHATERDLWAAVYDRLCELWPDWEEWEL